MEYYVYIMTNKPRGVLYTGVTNNIARRAFEHKDGKIKGFTKRYNLHTLVYFEGYELITNAIEREKNIKKWYRQWKIELIEKENPKWEDLSGSFHRSDPNFTDALTHYVLLSKREMEQSCWDSRLRGNDKTCSGRK